MKRYRVKEVWTCTSWAYVDAPGIDLAEKLLDDGEGDFDEQAGEWAYRETVGEIEEVL